VPGSAGKRNRTVRARRHIVEEIRSRLFERGSTHSSNRGGAPQRTAFSSTIDGKEDRLYMAGEFVETYEPSAAPE
jgi:hypothetical protein